MAKFPDTSKMLPSEARESIVEYLFLKLKEARINYLGRPVYSLADALRDARGSDDYTGGLVIRCFEEALEKYYISFPLGWDRETPGEPKPFRVGLPRDKE
jgi:hypothetical protein